MSTWDDLLEDSDKGSIPGVLRKLWRSGSYFDLTVRCGDRKFEVHKCIVCTRSKWFRKACNKRKWKDGANGVIVLKAIDTDSQELDYSCDDPEAVELMFEFVYMNDYRTKELSITKTVLNKLKASEKPSLVLTEEIEEPDIRYTMFEVPEPEPKQPEEQTAAATPGPATTNGTSQEPNQSTNATGADLWDDEDLWGWGFSKKDKKKKKKNVNEEPSVITPEKDKTMSFLATHAIMYAMGAKYDIPTLREAAVKKIKTETSAKRWDNDDFTAALSIAFASSAESDSAVREALVGVMLKHATQMTTDPMLEKAISEIDNLAFELFRRQSLKLFQVQSDPWKDFATH